MIVVGDSSPLIGLARIGRLDLLTSLFGEVLVPPSVFQEVTRPSKPASNLLRAWAGMVRTGSPSITLEAVNGLDPGEASAILIALERKADLLLLDERKGRRVAQELGIPVMGALGVILRAKACGLIPAARPLAEALSQFVFLDSLTVELALQSVGEH